jgi:acetylornithine deacetylase/succinyl-diaminopimelate desuccinylase-like protein
VRSTTSPYSRGGGADNKGQHLANVLGALDAARAGRAQWRVRIILDGEEEHGSPNLDAIARAHRARLAADLLVGSDGPKQKNAPTLVMGVRAWSGSSWSPTTAGRPPCTRATTAT